MTEAYEEDWLVRVRAQVMCRDEATGGWLPLGGGGLSNVMVRKRPRQGNTPRRSHQGSSKADHQKQESDSSAHSSGSKHSSISTSKNHQPLTSTDSRQKSQPHHSSSDKVAQSANDRDGSICSSNNSWQRTHPKKANGNGSKAGPEDGMMVEGEAQTVMPSQEPKYEYFIYGKRISDQAVILSCTIKKDFQYNKVMPTFHHWVTDEKRFGLTFQTAADARAFDKGVRTAIEEMLDGLGGSWPSLRVYKKNKSSSKDDEDNIFECLNLPTDSHSSSENSTASRKHQRRNGQDEQTPICNINAVTFPPYASAAGRAQYLHTRQATRSADTSPANKELARRQKLDGPSSHDAAKMAAIIGDQLASDNYSYVELTAVHEYIYPHIGPSGLGSQCDKSPSSQRTAAGSNTTTHSTKSLLDRRDSISSVKKHALNLSYASESHEIYQPRHPPPLPAKKKTSKKGKEGTFHARRRCRYCQEWYLESVNRAGACEYAPDCFKSCIHDVTLMKCAQCMMYHCMSDSEGDFATNPCECSPTEEGFCKRWLGLTLLACCVPCLWCYPLLSGLRCCCMAAGIGGGKHAPQ